MSAINYLYYFTSPQKITVEFYPIPEEIFFPKNNVWTSLHLSFVPFHPNIRLTEILPKRPREYRKENVVERSCINSIFARFDIQLDTSFKPSFLARDLFHRMALSSRVRFHRGRDARFEERLNRRRRTVTVETETFFPPALQFHVITCWRAWIHAESNASSRNVIGRDRDFHRAAGNRTR